MRTCILAFFLFCTASFGCWIPAAQAQVAPADSTARPLTDTLATDSIRLAPARKGDMETTIKYSARDSIRLDVVTRTVYLYGDAKINYGTMTLTAAFIEINWGTNILTATPLTDSTGKEIGIPVFVDEPEKYTARKIAYNFKTKKGRISGVITQQGEGYIHGETVKKTDDNVLFISRAHYTTCNLEHPHFYFNARRLKVIPDDRVISGPFNLVVGDVPTPLGFAFGLFPIPKKRASGLIVPTFGETAARGFFLRNGGFYWAVNDYIGTRILGEIYSLGGYGVQLDNQYFKRYSYNGRLNLRYNFRPASSLQDAVALRQNDLRDFWVDWQHAPIVKRGGRFSASVNAGTSTFNQYNNFNLANRAAATFQSAISYNKSIENTPFNYNINLRQNLNTITREQNFTLPDLNFNMSSLQPFANWGTSKSWYRNTRISYSVVAQNQFTNRFTPPGGTFLGITEDTVYDIDKRTIPIILDHSRTGVQHSIPITTNFKAFRFFTVSPSFNYNERWYFKKLNYAYQPDTQRVRIDTVSGFNRVYGYDAGASMNTRVYGVYYVKGKKLEAIRHMVSPTVGFRYSPDFSRSSYGYYQQVQINEQGTTQPISHFNGPGFLYGTPTATEQANITFSLQNNLEAKVRAKNDTSETSKFEKRSIIDNFDVSSFYNLAADSFQLGNFNATLRTTLFKVLGLQLGATYDPYQLDLTTGRRINSLLVSNSFRPLRLTTANLAVTANLNPQIRQRDRAVPVATDAQESIVRNINNNPDLYVDFTVPWSLAVNFTMQYFKTVRRRDNQFEEVTNFVNNLNFQGDVRLTDKWKVGFFSGYDFTQKQIASTTLNIYRDLHCWEMGINWIPFGTFQSYSVTINAKASILQDLKLQRNRLWYDR